MTLNGLPFIGGAALAALVTTIATVWCWPRLARSGVPALLARFGLVVLAQVLFLVAVAAWANHHFGFYASFDDLAGAGSHKVRVVTQHAGAAPITARLVRKRAEYSAGANPARDGVLETVELRGERSGINTKAYVFLPPQYYQKGNEKRHFPVVLTLSGYPGPAHNLIARLRIPRTGAAEMRKGQMQPTVLVLMRPTVSPPRDTECTDVPRGPQTATFFSQDLPEIMKAHYRVSRERTGWGVLGYSSGGYCALKLAMRHSDHFSAAAALSGYYEALKDRDTGDLYGNSPAVRDENDLTWRLRNLPPPPVSVMVTTTRSGERNLQSTERFVSLIRPPMSYTLLTLDSGGHNFQTWSRMLVPALRFMGKHLTP